MDNCKNLAYKEAYEDGYADGLSVNVSIMSPKSDEYVALFYDTETIDLDTLNESFKKLEEKMSTSNIIVLPNNMCLKNCDKQFLEQYIELIKKAIDELEDI